MKKININLNTSQYSILIHNQLLSRLDMKIDSIGTYDKIFIITQNQILQSYSENKIFKYNKIILNNSENVKNLSTIEKITENLIDLGCTRNSLLVGIGGGVVTDITGFLASVFMRGIDHVFIPTSLLAMVDAAIGGKTGVNINRGKNMIGTFNQPKAVFIDPTFLNTLDKRHIINGFAEIIKYGLISDKGLYNEVVNNFNYLITLKDLTKMEKIIIRCCELKRDIITKDEFDQNERMKLNFGHTIGHAIESYFSYKKILHGDAIYYGMVAESFISNKLDYLSDIDFNQINKFIESIPKYDLNGIDIQELFTYTQSDKKKYSNKKHFILLNEIGDAMIKSNISIKIIKQSLNFLIK